MKVHVVAIPSSAELPNQARDAINLCAKALNECGPRALKNFLDDWESIKKNLAVVNPALKKA